MSCGSSKIMVIKADKSDDSSDAFVLPGKVLVEAGAGKDVLLLLHDVLHLLLLQLLYPQVTVIVQPDIYISHPDSILYLVYLCT